MWQTRSRKSLTRLSCFLQRSLWNVVFIQSSMLHTLTLLECQHTDRYLSEEPRMKLFLLSSHGDLKWSSVHSCGSRKTCLSRTQVRDKLRRLSLSRYENRCSKHSWSSSVRCIARLEMLTGLLTTTKQQWDNGQSRVAWIRESPPDCNLTEALHI